MRRDQLPPHKTATYVLPQWKTFYVSVNKAACTSLKWLIADLQGESAERFHQTLSSEISRTMTIHRRSRWQHTPMATDLTDGELAAISPDTGWFVFGVVRHPTVRMFSAWQSKLLLHEPWWVVDDYGDQSWFPRIPRSTEDIAEDFAKFVTAMAEDPGQRIMRNRHFAPQRDLLVPDRMPYTRIYTTGEIPRLLEDFDRHLQALGWHGTLTLPSANETPLRPLARLFPPDVADAVRAIYQRDFDAFDYEDVVPESIDRDERYPDAALAEVGRLVERSERINDLALRARKFRGDAAAARKQAAAAAGANSTGRRVRQLAARARKAIKHR